MSGRRVRRSVWHYIRVGLSAGFLALIVLLAAAVIVVPRLTGAVPLTVLTSSMEPTLPPGTLIVVRETPVEDIRIGTVMTYQIKAGDPAVVTHRVVGLTTSTSGEISFTTQGDNNPQPDPNPVIEAQVKGTLWYSVPLIGHIAVGLNGADKTWIVTIIGVLLLGWAVWLIVGGVRDRRRRRRTPVGND